MRIRNIQGVYSPGYVMPTSRTGRTQRKQRVCPECHARPYYRCQRAHTDADGVTTWTPIKTFHKGR